jgi:UDP-N-acetylglucosamine:LPS N-acetylglucosamine transferase
MAIGGSHLSTARAMAEAVEAAAPGRFEIEVRELLREWGFAGLDDEHRESVRRMFARPWQVVWGRRFIDLSPTITQLLNRRMLRPFARAAAERLRADPPALVVANHAFLCNALTMVQRELGVDVPVLTFLSTTLDVVSIWAVREAERFFVGAPVAREKLAAFGVPPAVVDVVGYPVREPFLHRVEKTAARAELGLADRFTCLLHLGGEGVGRSPIESVRALRAADFSPQIVAITGKNPGLRTDLRAAVGDDPLVRTEGYVEEIWRYMHACDVVIAKTGPASTLEALSCGRPVIAPSKSGPNENLIARWLEERDLGGLAATPGRLVEAVRRYHDDAAAGAKVQAKTAAYDFVGMKARVGRYIAHYAQHRRVDPEQLGAGLK